MDFLLKFHVVCSADSNPVEESHSVISPIIFVPTLHRYNLSLALIAPVILIPPPNLLNYLCSLPVFQSINIHLFLLAALLSRLLVADLPPDPLQSPLLCLSTKVKEAFSTMLAWLQQCAWNCCTTEKNKKKILMFLQTPAPPKKKQGVTSVK